VRGNQGSWRRLTGSVLLALLFLSACKDGGRQGRTAGTTTTVPGSPTSTVDGSTPTTVDPALGALQRKDAPPEGVKEQLDFFAYYQGPEASCSGLEGSKPAVVVSTPNAGMATAFAMCFPGFTPKQPVDVDVRAPDGEVRRVTASEYTFPEEVAYATWTTVPGDELGEYKVTATQGRRRARGGFSVEPATSPSSVAVEPTTGPAGTTFRFGFAGFDADRVIETYLYRNMGRGDHGYLTAIPVTTDEDGQAVLGIPTTPDDPKGSYCLIRRGPGASPDYFCGLAFTVT
jgi:hypothetical protein